MEDNVREMYEKARAAFKIVEFWPQEKVDEMVLAVGWELQKPETADELARMAVEKSGIGVYEDKVHKIGTKVRGTLFDQIGVKTCGLVEEDKAKGDPEVRCRSASSRTWFLARTPSRRSAVSRFHVEDAQCDHLFAPPPYGAGDLYDGRAHPQGVGEGRRAGGSGSVHPPHE